MICSECGSPYERKTIVSGGKQIKVWRCKKKNGECHNHLIHENELIEQIGGADYLEIEKVIINQNRTIKIEMKKRYYSLLLPTISCNNIEYTK